MWICRECPSLRTVSDPCHGQDGPLAPAGGTPGYAREPGPTADDSGRAPRTRGRMKLGFLEKLYPAGEHHDGSGFATVYLDTSPTEATRKEVGLRWRAARGELPPAGGGGPTPAAPAGPG